MWLLVVHSETWLKASVAEPVLAAQQVCGWHWLFLCGISAGIVGKHDGVLASSGSRETEERRQLLPAHTLAPCGGSVCPSPGQAERGEQTGLRPGGGRDHVSS